MKHNHHGHDRPGHVHEPHGHDGHAHEGHAHHHGGPGHVHAGTDMSRVLFSACLTCGFMVVEALAGLLTGSLALLADAGHMLTDSIALGLAWYAFRISGRAGT